MKVAHRLGLRLQLLFTILLLPSIHPTDVEAAVGSVRERPEGPWQETATAVASEATLVEQPRGKELEYRIVAINKAGESEPSNTVMAVL